MRSTASRAFTLLEMIVVIAIIGLIAAFVVPAAMSVVNGSRLTQAAGILTNQLSYARQSAMVKNRAIEVRFLRFQDPESPAGGSGQSSSNQFRAIQLLEVQDGGALVTLGKVEFLPDATVLCADNRSSMLDSETVTQAPKTPTAGDPPMPRGIEMHYDYVSFRFLPDGSTNLAANHNWFVSVVATKDQTTSSKLPANFFILQVDPLNGIIHSFRPNVG